MNSIIIISIALLFTLFSPSLSELKQNSSNAKCDVSYENISANTPLELAEVAKKIIVYNTPQSSYTYLNDDSPLFTPIDIDTYYRSGMVSLSPLGNYIFSPYVNDTKNLLLYITELGKNDTNKLSLRISDHIWQGENVDIPYWFDTSTIIVPLKLNSNEYDFSLVQPPKSDLTHIKVKFANGTPLPRRTPILSPDKSSVAYIGLSNNHDSLVIYDIIRQAASFETKFNQIDSIGLIKWSSNGKYLAFQHLSADNVSSISVINKKGDELDSFDIELSSSNTNFVSDLFEWSPDGTNLFYVDQVNETTWSKVLVNVETKRQTRICIPAETYFSHNGEYILMTETHQSEGIGRVLTKIYIYDIVNNKIYSIDAPDLSDVGSILGWG